MAIGRRATQHITEKDAMRCIVDETGQILFASAAMGWALGVEAATLTAKPAAALLNVVSADSGGPIVAALTDLASGFYDVALLRPRRDPVVVPARLDRVSTDNGRCCTVLWLDPDRRVKQRSGEHFGQAATDFASLVVGAQGAAATEEGAAGANVTTLPAPEADLRHFLNLTSDILAVCRKDGGFLRVNYTFNRVLGYSDDELRRIPFLELIPSEERAGVAALMKTLLRATDDAARIDFISRCRGKDGGIRWMEWTQRRVGDFIYVVGRDITDIRQHEDELCRREEQLSEAQKIGRMGHWYWEIDRQHMDLSDQIYTIFGVEKGVFEPSVANINALLIRRDLGRVYRAFQFALMRKRDYHFEFGLRRPGGGIRYIRCEGRCKTDPESGDVTALFGIMQDITERKLYERTLRKAKDAAESAYAARSRFLANMSHELRTPLNAIIGFSEMIQRQLLGPVGNPRYLEYIVGIRESGEHLLDLITDILDMSKIEAGKYELYPEDVNIGKLIRLAVNMMEGRAQEAKIALGAEDIPDDIVVNADRRALMQILLNILSNAVKFTKADGSVTVSCAVRRGGIVIGVSDTGIGIPKDKLGVVTLPFEQIGSELTRQHEGSGLGLAITKDLIELHGGTLDIASKVGVGTTVTVFLPRHMAANSNASPA